MKGIQKRSEVIARMSDDLKRQIVDSYEGPLAQQVYHIPSGSMVSIWAMDLCKDEEYITTSDINKVELGE